MAHPPVRRGALELVGDRFLRERDGHWLDLATGLRVDVGTDAGVACGSASASVTRDHVDAWAPRESTVVVVEGRHRDGRAFAVRRARRPGECGESWCGTAAGAAAVRRLTEALDAVEPGRARVVHLRAPAGTGLVLTERAAHEACARGFAALAPTVAATRPAVLSEFRGRSVIVLAADEHGGDEAAGRLAIGSVLVASSLARAAAIVRILVDGTGPGGRAHLGTTFRVTREPMVERPPRVAQLLARRRFACCERSLRRRVYLRQDGEGADARVEAALLLAELQRHRGRSRAALSTLAQARHALSSVRQARAAFDVAAALGCLRTDLGHLATARDVLEGAWAASIAAVGRGHASCGVMLARCCAWQGQVDRASEVLDLVAIDPAADDATAARWWGLRARLSLARGDVGGAHQVLRDAAHARQWGDPLATAYLSVEAVNVHAALANADGVARAARVGSEAAARVNSLLAAATLRVALVRARLHLGQARERLAPARWLARHRGKLPPLVRWRVDRTLHEAGMIARCRVQLTEWSGGVGAPSPNASLPGRRSDVVDEVVDVLRICQDTDDERDALGRICTLLRSRLGAVAVGFDAEDGTPLARASATSRVAFSLAERAVSTGSSIPPFEVDAGFETAAAVRYGGRPIAALCARWCLDDRPDGGRAVALLTTAAAAAAPAVRTVLDRRALPSCASGDNLDIVGGSRAIEELRQQVRQVAHVPFPVLIEGESGSGKELVARALHRAGARRHRRFCAINCAALTDDLLEAELFGHARGAFTGAITERAGVFEEADGGTLFLDEVTELSPRAQAKLLRVLQEGEVRRVGENVARRVDVRIVAATNRSLSQEVGLGRFRDDLRYRLDVVRLLLPPLRERREDVGLLAAHFWKDAAARAGSKATLDPEALAMLARYHWPGNVRELQNVMALLAVSAPRRGRVAPGMLPASVRLPETGRGSRPARLDAARRSFEEAFVRDALARNGGRRGSTALELGVTRQGLAKLLARLGLDEPVSKIS